MVGAFDAGEDGVVDVISVTTDRGQRQVRAVAEAEQRDSLEAESLPEVVDVVGAFDRREAARVDAAGEDRLAGGRAHREVVLEREVGVGEEAQRRLAFPAEAQIRFRLSRPALVEQDDVGHGQERNPVGEPLGAFGLPGRAAARSAFQVNERCGGRGGGALQPDERQGDLAGVRVAANHRNPQAAELGVDLAGGGFQATRLERQGRRGRVGARRRKGGGARFGSRGREAEDGQGAGDGDREGDGSGAIGAHGFLLLVRGGQSRDPEGVGSAGQGDAGRTVTLAPPRLTRTSSVALVRR